MAAVGSQARRRGALRSLHGRPLPARHPLPQMATGQEAEPMHPGSGEVEPSFPVLPERPRRLRLVTQRVGRCGLQAVAILVRAPHCLLEARQVLLDPRTRILTEEGGDHVRELAARGIVLEGYADQVPPSGVGSKPSVRPGKLYRVTAHHRAPLLWHLRGQLVEKGRLAGEDLSPRLLEAEPPGTVDFRELLPPPGPPGPLEGKGRAPQ